MPTTAKKPPAKKSTPKPTPPAAPAPAPAPAEGYTVEMWPIARLKPYEHNAKIHTPEAIGRLASVIQRVGLLVPIVVDADGVILKGHRTRLAALSLGITTVPVRVAKHLSPEMAKAWRLADNRLSQDSEWNVALVNLELDSLRELNVDLALTGFLPHELELFASPPEVGDATRGLAPGEKLDTYENGTVRQIILVLTPKEYGETLTAFLALMQEHGLDTNVAVLLWMIERLRKQGDIPPLKQTPGVV